MNKIFKSILVLITFTSVLISAEMAVVNTDILLIKKEANTSSSKLGYYKMNDIIEILDSSGSWYKTNRGYVKSEFLIKKDKLPKFLNKEDVDLNKSVIQLIVYNLNAKFALLDLQKTLINENNLYIQKTNKAQVAYLVNFDSYSTAANKLKDIKKYYKSAFISKIRNKKVQASKSNTKLLIQNNKTITSTNIADIKSKFLNKADVDFSKYVVQLIVYNPNVSESLVKLRNTLKNEKNLYLHKTNRALVAVIANQNSYLDAVSKQKDVKKYFSTSFISKIKNKNIKNDVSKKPSKELLKFSKVMEKESLISNDEIVEELTVKKPKIEIIKVKSAMQEVVLDNYDEINMPEVYREKKPKKEIIQEKPTMDDVIFVKQDKYNDIKERKDNKPKKERFSNPTPIKKYRSKSESEKINRNTYYNNNKIEDEFSDFDIDKRMSEFEDDFIAPSPRKIIKKYIPRSKNIKAPKVKSVEKVIVKSKTVNKVKTTSNFAENINSSFNNHKTKKENIIADKKKILDKQIKEVVIPEKKEDKNFNKLLENMLIGL